MLIASGVLCMAAGTTAQAAPIPVPPNDSTQCSAWSTSIPFMRYRECLVHTPASLGANVRTGLQVINATHTDRYVHVVAETINRTNDGDYVTTASCDARVKPGNSAAATCWDYSRFVWSGTAVFGQGTLTDISSGQTGTAARSPTYWP